jgi:hypothetical protein
VLELRLARARTTKNRLEPDVLPLVIAAVHRSRELAPARAPRSLRRRAQVRGASTRLQQRATSKHTFDGGVPTPPSRSAATSST